MNTDQRKDHWNTIYSTKSLNEVSWYQPTPQSSLDLIRNTNCKKTDKIIDIGGGDSFLVDHLLDNGFTNISVLDISEKAILKAKNRLGDRANLVTWIVADIAKFTPIETYNIWHDRAAFHFLTQENDIKNYKNAFTNGIKQGGTLILGTFSENGPLKCSGIPIKQYSSAMLHTLVSPEFKQEETFSINHTTPSSSTQNFTFGRFSKL